MIPGPVRRARVLLLLAGARLLAAQGVNDLNSLILQAERYARREMALQGHCASLALCVLEGTRDGGPGAPMEEAGEVRHWRLTYRILPEGGPRRAPLPGASLEVSCFQGVFQDLRWQPFPVMDHKDLRRVWIPLPLDEAVRILKASGFRGGFTRVTLQRILHPQFPDACTYVFQCPLEGVAVGISAQTGERLWTKGRGGSP